MKTKGIGFPCTFRVPLPYCRLSQVCKAVLYGGYGIAPVPKETRVLRASGLLELSKVLKQIGEAQGLEDPDPFSHIAVQCACVCIA